MRFAQMMFNLLLWLAPLALSAKRVGAQHPHFTADQTATMCKRRHVAVRDRAVANENRVAQGTFKHDTLTLHSVMRTALWFPEDADGCALPVHVFAEEGGPAQVPGPLIRVHAGVTVRVSVRNALSHSLWIRGLQDRDTGMLDSAEIKPGSTRSFAFRASAPGDWYYWAGGAESRVPSSGQDGQLVGGLVVDSASSPTGGRTTSPRSDRVFVLTRWTPEGKPGNSEFQLNTINGRSWPYTERLAYTVGDSIRWHVINASDELHMMHLHGFYYQVISRGDATHDSTLARLQQNVVVTSAVRRGEWMSTVWTADRPGNWLFHCHILTHMSGEQRLNTNEEKLASHVRATNGADSGPDDAHSMAGLVLGVTIRPRVGTGHAQHDLAQREDISRARLLQLYADSRPRGFGEHPDFGFVLQVGDLPPAVDSILIPGSPIVLTRGAPVAMTVHNRLGTAIGVHWHGIELTSYYDGVPGWSGFQSRVAPVIAPGDSFVVRFTPPRSGTFIYHVHGERGDELACGLYGALLVMDPGQKFDPVHDHLLVIGTGGPGAEAPSVINGSMFPDTITLRAGTTHRLRVIDISANDAHATMLRGPGGVASWRLLARDGRDVLEDRRVPSPARENLAAGVTRDFEFTPSTPGDYSFSATTIAGGKLTSRVVAVPIRVTDP